MAAAVRVYLATRRADIERGVGLAQLDGSRQAEMALLSGLSADDSKDLGELSS